MATVFFSHSSADDDIAEPLRTWLAAKGFGDVFTDHATLRAGDRWTDHLRRENATCRVVLCLVTPNWLASDECFGEFMAAWYQGKRVIPLTAFVGETLDETQRRRFGRLIGHVETFDLEPSLDGRRVNIEALDATGEPLVSGLVAAGARLEVGLDPGAFEIDSSAAAMPYPGLESFDDVDESAAIFFGRSVEIARCLEELRDMRAKGVRQPYVAIGSSGSGKSSLIKAGVLPRLRRERGWLVLRAFRPGPDPLYAFADAMSRTLSEREGAALTAGAIRDDLRDQWLASRTAAAGDRSLRLAGALEHWLSRFRLVADDPEVTVLITVDQAEELARGTVKASQPPAEVIAGAQVVEHPESESAAMLCDYLCAAVAGSPTARKVDAMLAMTARTDLFHELQRAPGFRALVCRCADIRPVPFYRFAEVIEGPARRFGLQIDPSLVSALVDDAPSQDALPIVAFALNRLWKEYGAERHLRAAHYVAVGKLTGLVDDAAERALRGLEPGNGRPFSPAAPTHLERLGASTFVPALVQVSESGALIRQSARVDRFGQDALDLIESFVRWRLVVRHPGLTPTSGTFEVAHEVVFRSWRRLQKWTEPEKERCLTLADLKSAATRWDLHGRSGAYVDHRGARLLRARQLREHETFGSELTSVHDAYLQAAAARQRKGRLSMAATLVALLAAIAAGWAYVDSDRYQISALLEDPAIDRWLEHPGSTRAPFFEGLAVVRGADTVWGYAQKTPPFFREIAIMHAAAALVEVGRPDDAEALVRRLPKDDLSSLLAELGNQLVRRGDCDRGERLAASITNPTIRDRYLRDATGACVARGRVEQSLRIASQIADREGSELAKAQVIDHLLDQGDRAGAKALASQLVTPLARARAAIRIGSALAEHGDFAEAEVQFAEVDAAAIADLEARRSVRLSLADAVFDAAALAHRRCDNCYEAVAAEFDALRDRELRSQWFMLLASSTLVRGLNDQGLAAVTHVPLAERERVVGVLRESLRSRGVSTAVLSALPPADVTEPPSVKQFDAALQSAKHADAIDIATRLAPRDRSQSLLKVAAHLAGREKAAEAEALLPRVDRTLLDGEDRLRLAATLVTLGKAAEAAPLVDAALASVRSDPRAPRSARLADVAIQVARLGRLREARLLAAECPEEQRMPVYTEILKEFGRLKKHR
jgi:hypothetical protein